MNNYNFITRHYKLVKIENMIFIKWCKKYNIPYMYAHLLLSIYDDEEYSNPTKLSETLLIPKQSITSILDKLEKKGYIIRNHSEKDRRKIDISLTEDGIKVVHTLRNAYNMIEEKVLKQININEIENMLDTYEKIIEITAEHLFGGY